MKDTKREDLQKQYIAHMMTYDLFTCLSQMCMQPYQKPVVFTRRALEFIKEELAGEMFGERICGCCAYCEYTREKQSLIIRRHCLLDCPGLKLWGTKGEPCDASSLPCYEKQSPYNAMLLSQTKEEFNIYALEIAAFAKRAAEKCLEQLKYQRQEFFVGQTVYDALYGDVGCVEEINPARERPVTARFAGSNVVTSYTMDGRGDVKQQVQTLFAVPMQLLAVPVQGHTERFSSKDKYTKVYDMLYGEGEVLEVNATELSVDFKDVPYLLTYDLEGYRTHPAPAKVPSLFRHPGVVVPAP